MPTGLRRMATAKDCHGLPASGNTTLRLVDAYGDAVANNGTLICGPGGGGYIDRNCGDPSGANGASGFAADWAMADGLPLERPTAVNGGGGVGGTGGSVS